jgi:hypothetical protein
MFQSYKYKNTLDKTLDKNNCGWYFQYELTDSEFGTVSGLGVMKAAGIVSLLERFLERYSSGIGIAVIQEYSRRNLNVAANLATAFAWHHNKKYHYWSVQGIIDHNRKLNPLFPPYEKDLQKYLVLL